MTAPDPPLYYRGQDIENVFARWRNGAMNGHELLEGPLSDLSVLIHIPAVRELVEEVEDIASQFGGDYLFEKHNESYVRPWIDALEDYRACT